MVYDGHAYCFPDLRGDGGFGDAGQFRRHLQLGIASHFQRTWRKRDRAGADGGGLVDPSRPPGFAGLMEAGFRPAGHGRFEWTFEGEEYVKQYMPPSVVNMSYPPEDLVAEMDYAGVDRALLHRTPYLGIGNDFVAECVGRFPDRLQGLAHVEEWLIQTEPDASVGKLERAIADLGLSGLQFLPDQMSLYGQAEEWDSDGFRPFWDAVAGMGIPVFFTPSYTSLAASGGQALAPFLVELGTLRRWMERYPDVTVVLTHGFGWRSFRRGDALSVPDEVFDAAPADNPNFYLQVLFPIFFGGEWEYPMPEVRPTLEKLVGRIGPTRLIWGTDIPMVMRFYTYRQSLDYLRLHGDFIGASEMELVVGGNMMRLMGLDG